MRPFHIITFALFAGGAAVSALAQVPTGETRSVHVPHAAMSPGAYRTVEARLQRAALEVCGASRESLAEVRRAARQSQCWRDAYGGAVAQLSAMQLAIRPALLTSTDERPER
jgi:UrcA family protein